jgi:hypothetical protein
MRGTRLAYNGEMTNAYKGFTGKSEEKRPFDRARCKRENNIEMASSMP